MSGLLDYYIAAGYTTPEVADPPSPDDYFVRADDIIWVEAGYVDNGYIQRTFSGVSDTSIFTSVSVIAQSRPPVEGVCTANIATLVSGSASRSRSGSATINDAFSVDTSISGTKVGETIVTLTSSASVEGARGRSSSATLWHNGEEVSWENMNTWLEPTQETWQRRVSASAVRLRRGTALNINSTTGVLATATRIKTFSATLNSSATVLGYSSRNSNSSSTTEINSTLSANGITVIHGTSTPNIASSVNSNAFVKFYGTVTTNAATTTVVSSGRIRPAVIVDQTISGMQVSGGRIRPSSSECISNLTVTISGSATSRSSATDINSAATVTVEGARSRSGISNPNIIVEVDSLGGKRLGAADLEFQIITSASAQARLFTVEPFRTIRVLPTQRLWNITQETRIINTKIQTRINTATSETRNIRVNEETRDYLIDNGTLVTTSVVPFRQERI